MHMPRGIRSIPRALYRELYDYKAPCCICALDTLGAVYTESAVYIAHSGPYTGEYVAGCATGSCGYLGESITHSKSHLMAADSFPPVPFEHLHEQQALMTCKYPRRGRCLCMVSGK